MILLCVNVSKWRPRQPYVCWAQKVKCFYYISQTLCPFFNVSLIIHVQLSYYLLAQFLTILQFKYIPPHTLLPKIKNKILKPDVSTLQEIGWKVTKTDIFNRRMTCLQINIEHKSAKLIDIASCILHDIQIYLFVLIHK